MSGDSTTFSSPCGRTPRGNCCDTASCCEVERNDGTRNLFPGWSYLVYIAPDQTKLVNHGLRNFPSIRIHMVKPSPFSRILREHAWSSDW